MLTSECLLSTMKNMSLPWSRKALTIKASLEKADHFGTTLFYHHKLAFYESMLDFLANDCGLEDDAKDIASIHGLQ